MVEIEIKIYMWWYIENRIGKFFFVSFLAGFLFGLVSIPKVGLITAFSIGVLFGVSGGGTISCLAGFVDYFSLKPLYKKYGKVVLLLHQKDGVVLDKPQEIVVNKCREILKDFGDVIETNTGDIAKSFRVRTTTTFWSFGEKVTVSIKPVDKNKTSVYIESKPVVKWTLVDYGKNFKNVEKIKGFLLE